MPAVYLCVLKVRFLCQDLFSEHSTLRYAWITSVCWSPVPVCNQTFGRTGTPVSVFWCCSCETLCACVVECVQFTTQFLRGFYFMSWLELFPAINNKTLKTRMEYSDNEWLLSDCCCLGFICNTWSSVHELSAVYNPRCCQKKINPDKWKIFVHFLRESSIRHNTNIWNQFFQFRGSDPGVRASVLWLCRQSHGSIDDWLTHP